MLNRRLIRIRAMQTLYAYEKAKGANLLLSLDLIAESFSPDLNSMEKQDKVKLTGLKKLAQKLYQEEVSGGIFSDDADIPKEIVAVLAKARELYKNRNSKDFQQIKTNCVIEAERVYELYLSLLKFLPEIAAKFPTKEGLNKNKVIKALNDSKDLDYNSLRKGISWDNERIFINKVYNEAIKKNAHVIEYSEKVNVTLEDDLAIVKYLIKNVLLKHELFTEFFEKIHIFWSEDKEIIRTMLFSTFKEFIDTGNVNIEALDDVWEESKEFLKELFTNTVQNDKLYMSYLVPFLRNWEIDRIVETDRILLKMALTELINYPSIPVKVTINEIIEISKNFSTLKSGQFINGILDSAIISLTKKDIIKKSGRGMLDNK